MTITKKLKRQDHRCHDTGVNQVFLQVLPIRVINSKGNSVTAFALLDQGSQCTLIREDLADAAEIQGISENVRIGTIQGPGEVQSVSSTSFTIGSLVNKNTTFHVENAYIVKSSHFNLPEQSFPPFENDPRLQHLKGLGIKNVSSNQIKVLIGADVPAALIPKDQTNLLRY